MPSPTKDARKKRSKSLGGDENELAGPAKSILKPFLNAENTVIGVIEVALKDEEDQKKEKENRRKSLLNRRVSFAATASVRTFQTTPSPGTSASQTPGDIDSSSRKSSLRRSPRSPRSPKTPSPRNPLRNPLRVVTPPMNFNNPDDELSDEEEDMQISNDDDTSSLLQQLQGSPLPTTFQPGYNDEMTMELTGIVPPFSMKNFPNPQISDVARRSPLRESKDYECFDTKAQVQSIRSPKNISPQKLNPSKLSKEPRCSPQSSPLVEYSDYTVSPNVLSAVTFRPAFTPENNVDDTVPMEITTCVPLKPSSTIKPFTPDLANAISSNDKKNNTIFDEDSNKGFTKYSSALLRATGNSDQKHLSRDDETVEMEFTRIQKEQPEDYTQTMEMTKVIGKTKQCGQLMSPTLPQSTGLEYNTQAMDVITSTAAPPKGFSSSFHTPLRQSRRGSLAVDMLTGARQSEKTPIGSPRAVEILTSRSSMAGAEDLKNKGMQILPLGQWKTEEFGGGPRGIHNRIKLLTPSKATVFATPEKLSSIKRKFVSERKHSPSPKQCRLMGLRDINSQSPVLHKDNTAIEDQQKPLIRLNDFLRMISITFLDGLTTTRRRETIVIPNNFLTPPSLGDYVHTTVSTLPLLEMYQFSCKELKKYISEGRDVVKRIDRETLEETPLLFQEYTEAGHDLRQIMDGQFRLLKSHSRLLAKGVWYEWRKKLMEGVGTILEHNLEGLLQDEKTLEKLEPDLGTTFERISHKHAALKEKLEVAQVRKNAFDASDKTESESARKELESTTADLQSKKRRLDDLTFELSEMHANLAQAEISCKSLEGAILEARKFKDDICGLHQEEIIALKEKCKALESVGGWTVKAASQQGVELILYGELSVRVTASVVELELLKHSISDLDLCFLTYAKEKVRLGNQPPFQRLTLLQKIWHKFRLINLELSILQSVHPVVLTVSTTKLTADTSVFNAFHAVKLIVSITLDCDRIEEKKSLSESVNVNVNTIYGSVDDNFVQQELCRRVALGGLGMLREGCREISHIIAQSAW